MDFSTDWLTYTYLLTYLLMPTGKHNSRMARARDLISSLINVASSRDVPFHQPQQLQCWHHGATFVPLWSPILSSQLRKVTICGRHAMASVRDIQITEALLTLCLAYYVMKRVRHCWKIEALWLSRIEIWGTRFTSIFSVMVGWIAEILFMMFFAYSVYCCVTDRT